MEEVLTLFTKINKSASIFLNGVNQLSVGETQNGSLAETSKSHHNGNDKISVADSGNGKDLNRARASSASDAKERLNYNSQVGVETVMDKRGASLNQYTVGVVLNGDSGSRASAFTNEKLTSSSSGIKRPPSGSSYSLASKSEWQRDRSVERRDRSVERELYLNDQPIPSEEVRFPSLIDLILVCVGVALIELTMNVYCSSFDGIGFKLLTR